MTTLAVLPINTVPTSLRHTAALHHLSDAHRALVEEALTVRLDYVKNDLFKKASSERALFEDGLDIAPAPTSWYHPMIDDELIGNSAPSSSLLNANQERHLFLRYNYARMRAQAAVKKFRTHPSKTCSREIAQIGRAHV